MKLFGQNLRNRAKQLGISNAEVARRLEIGERRYASYVKGDREPDLNTLVRIARVLQLTPNDLLGFGQKSDDSEFTLLIDRIASAIGLLDPVVVDALVAQIEALAIHRRKSIYERNTEL